MRSFVNSLSCLYHSPPPPTPTALFAFRMWGNGWDASSGREEEDIMAVGGWGYGGSFIRLSNRYDGGCESPNRKKEEWDMRGPILDPAIVLRFPPLL